MVIEFLKKILCLTVLPAIRELHQKCLTYTVVQNNISAFHNSVLSKTLKQQGIVQMEIICRKH